MNYFTASRIFRTRSGGFVAFQVLAMVLFGNSV
jgi:hypothetical protein